MGSGYARARDRGIWEAIAALTTSVCRKITGRSVTTAIGGEEKGFDGGKKIKGRKRHIVVDVLGCILALVVHAANIHDTNRGGVVIEKAIQKYPSIQTVCADQGYRGTTVRYVEENLKRAIEISTRDVKGFAVVKKRWIVERTFAWFGHCRRLAKDYERKVKNSESMVLIAYSMILLKRVG